MPKVSITTERVLSLMKERYGEELTKRDIVNDLGETTMVAVNAVLNGLCRKGVVALTREEVVEDIPPTATRKGKYHTNHYYTMTEKGLAYDPMEALIAQNEKRKIDIAAKRAEAKKAKAEEAKTQEN